MSQRIRLRFQELAPRVKAGNPRAQFELAQLLLYPCRFAWEFSSGGELRTHYENSVLAHVFDYTGELETFDACRHVLDHAPSQLSLSDWFGALMTAATEAGDAIALLSNAEARDAARMLDDDPWLLTEPHYLPRETAMRFWMAADPDRAEDEIAVMAWSAAVCAKSHWCELDEEWERAAATILPRTLVEVRETYMRLEARFEAHDPFHFVRLIEEAERASP